MSQTQSTRQATQALWHLSPGEALSMTIGPGPRELSVTEGRVWLTDGGSLGDVWLDPGQSVQLASGSRVVLEAWPSAQFQLLVPPTACAARHARPAGASAAWSKTPSGLAAA